MSHDVSSVPLLLSREVNVFVFVLCVINGTSTLMWSQCDTFLRICVRQGHTHYQWTRALPEGDRVTESGWRSEENLFLLSVLWCIFTCGFDDDCFCESPEWQERKGCSHRDLMWLPNINFMLWDKWKAKAFFLSLSLSIQFENYIFLCSVLPSGE